MADHEKGNSYTPSRSAGKHSKMTSIFLAERWSRVGDTVSAINCQLASLAAQNRQKKICCVVLKATEEEKKDAVDCAVELILPCLSDDIKDACENDEPSFKWLLSPNIYFSTLTKLQDVDYIIEHINSSTSFIFASALRKHCFKDADIVLINHDAPSADLTDKHLKFAEAAAAVFSVGPTVFEENKKFYQLTNIQIKHKLYLPRPEKAFFDLNVDQMSKTSDLKQILTVITEKKVHSTRFKTLAAAVGQVAEWFKSMYAKIPKWFVRTSSAADRNDTKTFLCDNLNCTCVEPNTYLPYGSQDEIYRDLKQSNVLVIPPDEPFRMEALWAIAAGLPVLIPRRTAMAEFLKKYFGERAEYFLYEPSVTDLSKQISKMLNSIKTAGVSRQFKNKFLSHTKISGSHETFTTFFTESTPSNTLTGADTAAVSPQHRHSADDGIGSIEDTSSEQSLSPQPVSAAVSPSHRYSTDDSIESIEDASFQQSLSPPPVSPEPPVYSHKATTSQVKRTHVVNRKRPFMPTIRCKADLEIEEKQMKMETAQPMERERQQFELQKERDEQQLKHQKEKDQLKFKKDNKKMLRAELKKLYDLQVKRIIARNSPDMEKQLKKAYKMFKAELDEIADGSLQFMLSFLSEEDIDYFWQKYKAADVEEVISSILITLEMRSLAEKARCSVKVRLKIDEKEFEIVKEILYDISAVYTFSKKTWVRTIAFNEWERYVLNHVHENQAEYLIQQSRFHPILSELRDDKFFFPSFVSYWYENMYNLPSTLTEATEYAIKHHVQQYCKEQEDGKEVVWEEVQKMLYTIGEQAFQKYPKKLQSFLQLSDFYEHRCYLELLDNLQLSHISPFFRRSAHSVHISCQHIYFYAVAVYLSQTQDDKLWKDIFAICVQSKPIVLYFIAGILKEKATSFIPIIYNVAKTYPVHFDLLFLLGYCFLESKYPEKFTVLIKDLFPPTSLVQSLDLSIVNQESISQYCLKAMALILKQTSFINNINFVHKEEMSSLSATLIKSLQLYINSPESSVEFMIQNMVQLTIVARCIAFNQLFITQQYSSPENLSETSDALNSITIKATDDTSYNIPIKAVRMLVGALASCSLLKYLHLSGFNNNFIISFLQAVAYHKRLPLTVTTLELPQNKLDSSSARVILQSVQFFPFLEKLDVSNNNLGYLGIVALLPLADVIIVCFENNWASESIDSPITCETLAEQIGDLQPYMSEMKTLDDIKKLQMKSAHVTRLNVSTLPIEIVNLMCLKLPLFGNLKEIDFSSCGITGDNAIILADTFEYLNDLQHVNLSSNDIGDDGVVPMAARLASLENFTFADFSKTNISFRGMIRLYNEIDQNQHSKFNVSQNMTGLTSLHVDPERVQVSLDKIISLNELKRACERIRVSKQWGKEEIECFCQGLRALPVVRHLDLSNGNIGDVAKKGFIEVMEELPLLTFLSLSNNNIKDDTSKGIARRCMKLQCLDHLDLSHNNIQDFRKFKAIEVKGIENPYSLRHLDLSHNKIGDNGAESVSNVIELLPRLTYLSLSNNNIGDVGATMLGNKIANKFELRYFDLSHNNIQEAGAKTLSVGIEKLEHLDLSYNYLGVVGTKHVLAQLEKSIQLRYLNLSHNSIGDDGAEVVGRGIDKLPLLNYLGLSYNNIGDFGVEKLIHKLENLEHLEHIDLGHNMIGDTAAKILSEMINVVTKSVSQDHGHADDRIMHLKYLDLQNNCITDSGAHLLKSTIEKIGVDLFVDLSHNKVLKSNIPQYLGKKPSSRSDKAPRTAVPSAPVTAGSSIGLKYYSKTVTLTSHSDLGLDRSSFTASRGSTDGQEVSSKKLDSSSATSGIDVSRSSAVTGSPATGRKHSSRTASHQSDPALSKSSLPASTDSIGEKEVSFKEPDIDSSSASSGMGISHSFAKPKDGLDSESDV